MLQNKTAATQRFFILAGEASGDILGADLIRALKVYYPDAIYEGVAGEKMQAEGCESLLPLETLSVMGIVDVLLHLRSILAAHRRIIKHLKKYPPTVFIGIDLPDTNLRIAKKIKAFGIKTVQYVSPSIWAWRQNRVHAIQTSIDLVLPLFPFEAVFYAHHGVKAQVVGHTLADHIPRNIDKTMARTALNLKPDQPTLALLPGSRISEIARHAPIFLEAAQLCFLAIPDLHCVVPMINEERAAQFSMIWKKMAPTLPLTILIQSSDRVFNAATVALVVSGTATLEAMLYQCPMIVAYQLPQWLFTLIRPYIHVRYFSLPNLLAADRLVPEYIQADVNPRHLAKQMIRILKTDKLNTELIAAFDRYHALLQGGASEKAAKAIHELLACG